MVGSESLLNDWCIKKITIGAGIEATVVKSSVKLSEVCTVVRFLTWHAQWFISSLQAENQLTVKRQHRSAG